MGRTILAAVAGVVCAVATVAVIESIGQFVYPPPPGLDIGDPDQLRSIISRLPTGALWSVIVAWALGALVGGLVAARLSRDHAARAALVVGGTMIVLVGINLVLVPHPSWMAVLGLVVPLPMSRLGGRLVSRPSAEDT